MNNQQAELLAFSNIVGGLLSTGNYTHVDEDDIQRVANLEVIEDARTLLDMSKMELGLKCN